MNPCLNGAWSWAWQAGWGYGAAANNATEDFLGLLYGHMATYQSPGTFHSTEQMHFTGTGKF